MGKQGQDPEICKKGDTIQSCYEKTWEGIQGDTTSKELNFGTFNGKSRKECIDYIDSVFKNAYTSSTLPNKPIGTLINEDLNKLKNAKKGPSFKYLSAIQKACKSFKKAKEKMNQTSKDKKKIKIGITACEDLQKAFKGATKVSKEGAFLNEDDVKVYMERQSRALKLSVAKMKALLLKESTKNPIKKMLASSKEKYIQKKEAKYSSKAAHDKIRIFISNIKRENAYFGKLYLKNKDKENENYELCKNYLFDDKEDGGARVVAGKLVKIINNLTNKENFEDNERKKLDNIKEACNSFLRAVKVKPNDENKIKPNNENEVKPNDENKKFSAQVEEYNKIVQAFSDAKEFGMQGTSSFFSNTSMSNYLSAECVNLNFSAEGLKRVK